MASTSNASSLQYAKAIFTPCQQSHTFEDRRISFSNENSTDAQVKIGRAVAKLKPQVDNAIFDCKVLSRNHALMWFEDGKFFLKDTKSSNGTFVNNQRLSKSSEESPPREIFSGDILQFGVEIVENARKVTHGSIVCIARLYYPDGREAASKFDSSSENLMAVSSTAQQHNGSHMIINQQELFQLEQYLKEAVHREQLTELKLANLQSLVSSTQEASDNSWKALIDEDRLLSRIEMLEGQLYACSKNLSDSEFPEKTIRLQEEKERYESAGKEALRRALQEKMEAMQKLADVERSLENTEEECIRLKDLCTSVNKELSNLAEEHNTCSKRVQQLIDKCEQAEKRCQYLEGQVISEKLECDRIMRTTEKSSSILDDILPCPPGLSLHSDLSLNSSSSTKLNSQTGCTTQINWESEKEIFIQNNSSNLNVVSESDSDNDLSEHRLFTTLNNERDIFTQLNSAQAEVQMLKTKLDNANEDLIGRRIELETLHEITKKSSSIVSRCLRQTSTNIIAHYNNETSQTFQKEEFFSFLKDSIAQLELTVNQILFQQSNTSDELPSTASQNLLLLNGHLPDLLENEGDSASASMSIIKAGYIPSFASLADNNASLKYNDELEKYKKLLYDTEVRYQLVVDEKEQQLTELTQRLADANMKASQFDEVQIVNDNLAERSDSKENCGHNTFNQKLDINTGLIGLQHSVDESPRISRHPTAFEQALLEINDNTLTVCFIVLVVLLGFFFWIFSPVNTCFEGRSSH